MSNDSGNASRAITSVLLALTALMARAGGEDRQGPRLEHRPDAPTARADTSDVLPPFRFRYEIPEDGEVALAVDNAEGRRVRNLAAQAARTKGTIEEPWDLKDDYGKYVPPGSYRLKGIASPPIQLRYQLTPYPNIENFFPDRAPWLTGHSDPNGWLSDHSQNWACTALGDRVYFGAPMAEAGVCFIECDADGKKLRGKHDFGAWRGVNRLAADGKAVYIEATDGHVYRMEPETHKITKLFGYRRENRSGSLRAMAAGNGHVYLAFGGEPLVDSAASADSVDLDACLPRYPERVKGGRVTPNPRLDFLRALRLCHTPPGQNRPGPASQATGVWPVYLDSTFGPQRRQYIVVAFKEPVPIGSLVFPHPGGEAKIDFSVLKKDAPYPPRPGEDSDWTPFSDHGRPGWACIPAPKSTRTRALRIRFTQPGGNELEDLLDESPRPDEASGEEKPELGLEEGGDAGGGLEAQGKRRQKWLGRLEGMRILRRRFRSLATSAKVRVSSGTIDESGEWEAQRKQAIWRDDPGIHVMEWPSPQKVAGLAIKEIDGAVTEIDVWQGEGEIPLGGDALDRKSNQIGWRQVTTYRQKRRTAYEPSFQRNAHARYLDGVVDFHQPIETRAIRLRIVEQWMDNGDKNSECRRHDGRSEHGVHYMQSHTARLDTRVCRVLGVAPLEYLGGEAPVDSIAYSRLEVYDATDGRLVREVPARLGWNGMSCGPDGTLYSIHENHHDIAAIDPDTGQVTTVLEGTEPSKMTVGPDGLFYVNPWSDNGKAPIRVYRRTGELVREIGHAGGLQFGPWDPMRFGSIGALCVDRRGSLCVVESEHNPRRVLQYDTGTGRLVKEILGNTGYGGGGALHRYDRTRAFYGKVEFGIDWEDHKSRIRRLLPISGDLVAVRAKGHTYLTTAPLGHQDRQSHAVVYLDDAAGLPRMVAAFGDATHFEPLRTSAVISLMDGAPPKQFLFLWSDRNGNAAVDADEVELRKKREEDRWFGLGRFDGQLNCMGSTGLYEVEKFLPDGTPVYRAVPVAHGGHLRLANGNTLALHSRYARDSRLENFAVAPSGEKLWGYPVESDGVSGLEITPWRPGLVGNEFGIIGHEVAEKGGLGEFVVVHANTGQWRVWTADGLLAAQILLHKSDPRSRFFGPRDPAPGTRLDPLTGGQEHFHGFFTRTEADGKYFIVAGFNHLSLIEVRGLERCRRIDAELRVSAEDLRKVRSWEVERTHVGIQERNLTVQARWLREPPIIDGDAGPHEWPQDGTPLRDREVTFRMGADARFLYLCWSGAGLGEITNRGQEFQRYFKTGAAVDLMLGTDPTAPAQRRAPAKGDLRLLLTYVEDRPRAVLFQPVCPGAPEDERWSTYTEAGGKVAFDRVVLLEGVRMAMKRREQVTTVEAAVPLASLGLEAAFGRELKLDWGILTSNDGLNVKDRAYWANAAASGTSDEAVEARLEPYLWGRVKFSMKDDLDQVEKQLEKTEEPEPARRDDLDIPGGPGK